MRLGVVAVGALKEPAYRALVEEYAARIRHYVPLDLVEVTTDERLEPAVAKLASGGTRVALEVGGQAYDSARFATQLERWGSRGKGKVIFVVGGADGIPRPLSEAAEARVSLSTFTLPHRLARLVLVEQLYRAMSILRGTPYAH
jgi:23S rRNA (pseudouridine1915-N3)-methyltransferase